MHQNWPGLAAELNPLVADLRLNAPEVMAAFSQMAQAAGKAGALDAKTKELIAYALSVATRCDPCITYHAKAAARLGASKEEIAETLGMAIYMGAGPSVMYAAKALEAFEQYREKQAAA
ncbi:MAG TPA: carboxymuconolactone decarboxylase family protein [Caulobacterales bacterium]|nr:carboxymuconolactone decarboxylase family protein [Caulobacterales bacterium]